MKHILLLLSIACSSLMMNAQTYQPAPENLAARETFNDNRFGIFLHWGLYSMFAQGEWYMQNENIDNKEYAKVADAFYPHRFNARQWVKAFKDAGAKYICFTSRHHEGFSMWDTKQSDYNIMNTPFGRDIVRELADACHEEGLGFHLYYSHIDWTRDDYPTGRTGLHTGKNPQKADWNSYYAFMNSQLTELLTQYGKVDGIWFDGVWDHDNDKTPFNWQLPEQYALIHKLQPACLIGNNHHSTPVDGEDMQMFERDIPGENKAGLSGQTISRLPLETCQTMNGMWGYKIKDQNYKSTRELKRLLTRTAAKGANLLLNVGPQANGEIPAVALERFKEIGSWLRGYAGESIYQTEAGPVTVGEKIVSTNNPETGAVYIHLLSDTPIKEIKIDYPERPKRITTLVDGKPVVYSYDKKERKLSFSLNDDSWVEGDDMIVKIEK